ncbi:hypothetical protein Pla8534_36270 [Lignipirellula cremea]|uniref:Uncharacterized protein n=1 Tax=Lignipirellula cremea TaxID=2528010 RepID=A0A518DVF2_9BACT|nr:hypothetical protein Pla8534_36270 [Lignipirellula cremea]
MVKTSIEESRRVLLGGAAFYKPGLFLPKKNDPTIKYFARRLQSQ